MTFHRGPSYSIPSFSFSFFVLEVFRSENDGEKR